MLILKLTDCPLMALHMCTWSHAILWSAPSWYETKKELCQSVWKLRQCYEEYAEEQKKQRFSIATIEGLFKDADKYALDAA